LAQEISAQVYPKARGALRSVLQRFGVEHLAAMLRAQKLGLSLLALVALGQAGSPETGSQLRGSVAAEADQATDPSVEEQPRHTQCNCDTKTCLCTTSASGAQAEDEEQQQVQQAILNRTQELQRLWEAQGGMSGKVACDCVSGSELCSCGHDAEPASAAEVPSPALLNGTEQAMSLWWAGGGGYHYGYHYGYHAGYGGYGGGRYGGGRYGGCRCAWRGCGCGAVHGGGCGWR